MKNNRKYILFLVSILVILLVIGITYAWLTQTVIGEKVHSMRVGTFKFSLSEENSLTLDSAEFLKDSDGLNQDGFKFTVENTGVGYGNYSVYLDDDTLSSNQTRIDDKFIRYSLGINSDTVGTPTNLTSRKLYSGTLGSKEKDTFVLRVWLNKDVNGDIGGQVFKSKIRIEVDQTVPTPVAEKLLAGVGDKGSIDKTDPEQTFITGESPNNYIWYSGKLWRAVSIDPTDNSVKLVTQWNISILPSYNYSTSIDFQDSYMEQWLNDTSVDGFLGNLREVEKFVKTNSVWNATMTTDTSKPAKTTLVTDTVGLLNIYEYTMSLKNASSSVGYLNNSLFWWTLTPYNNTFIFAVNSRGVINNNYGSLNSGGCRPSINLKPNVKIVSGDGTSDNPYRLEGDSDNPIGVLLSTRYSGEYIRFGTGENNLYRIVSHENGTGTKIVSAMPLKDDGSYKTLQFGDNVNYSKDSTIGTFLNNEYLTNEKYLTNKQVNMIEDNTMWYLGIVGSGVNYKLAKYQDNNNLTTNLISAKIGMLRVGELMAGQFYDASVNKEYWTLTPYDNSSVRTITNYGSSNRTLTAFYWIRPSMNLKTSVIITRGQGTKEEPFTLSVQ